MDSQEGGLLMSEINTKYFSTGEFAKLCNINKKTLFHYDEIYKRFIFNDKETVEKYNKIYEKVKQYLEEKG